jgi:hypothetical protein
MICYFLLDAFGEMLISVALVVLVASVNVGLRELFKINKKICVVNMKFYRSWFLELEKQRANK